LCVLIHEFLFTIVADAMAGNVCVGGGGGAGVGVGGGGGGGVSPGAPAPLFFFILYKFLCGGGRLKKEENKTKHERNLSV
jgi:hypothetical protein